MSVPAPITVLVVDDSAFMRKMITDILAEDPALCVIGQARDGVDALQKVEILHPDVITLDVEMPIMDGFTALAEIMQRNPTPVVMLSSLTQIGAAVTMRCLEMGAVDFIGKPSGAISLDIEVIGADLIAKVKIAAHAHLKALPAQCPLPTTACFPAKIPFSKRGSAGKGVLVIGASTGGPRALHRLIPALPSDLGVPIVIIQHMPVGFTASLAARLDSESPFSVREAMAGDRLQPGTALVAPGGFHLQFDEKGIAFLSTDPPIYGVRPSVDVTLASLLKLYRERMVAVLLTGMGKDGARGLKALHDLGGETLAEDESTCVVYGMPKSAVDLGGVSHLLPLPAIAAAAAAAIQKSGCAASGR